MEEKVGEFWHRIITRMADTRYPQAAVTLDSVSTTVGIIFRALGGMVVCRWKPPTPKLMVQDAVCCNESPAAIGRWNLHGGMNSRYAYPP